MFASRIYENGLSKSFKMLYYNFYYFCFCFQVTSKSHTKHFISIPRSSLRCELASAVFVGVSWDLLIPTHYSPLLAFLLTFLCLLQTCGTLLALCLPMTIEPSIFVRFPLEFLGSQVETSPLLALK